MLLKLLKYLSKFDCIKNIYVQYTKNTKEDLDFSFEIDGTLFAIHSESPLDENVPFDCMCDILKDEKEIKDITDIEKFTKDIINQYADKEPRYSC